MATDYRWAAQVLPGWAFSLGDLAVLIGRSRWRARADLRASGLPARLLVFMWRYGDKCYVRRVWRLPPSTVLRLVERRRALEVERIRRALSRGGRKVRWRLRHRARVQLARRGARS